MTTHATTHAAATDPPVIRVAIVDDQELVRAGLRMILQQAPDLLVVAEGCHGGHAVDLAAHTNPDVILMDIRMPVMDGIQATHRIRATHPQTTAPKILILTTFDLDDYVYAALHAGANGFLLKDTLTHDLHDAIRIVHAGDAITSPSITRRLIAHYTTTHPHQDRARLARLTPREHQVLTLITHGLTNAEIATRLGLTEGTVKTHVSHILTKLDLRDRIQAVILGYQTGLAP